MQFSFANKHILVLHSLVTILHADRYCGTRHRDVINARVWYCVSYIRIPSCLPLLFFLHLKSHTLSSSCSSTPDPGDPFPLLDLTTYILTYLHTQNKSYRPATQWHIQPPPSSSCHPYLVIVHGKTPITTSFLIAMTLDTLPPTTPITTTAAKNT